MDKTFSEYSTPDGRPIEKLKNPFSMEADPIDFGEDQLLLEEDSNVEKIM